ncbi:carbamoyltransferase C-terminal domain-containing protein [Shimia ponticola]|uniref:carbamoyltransferase C-terminal domain-containing protein n=1 Tax=Shimia ponticola TaxID=2582893 RepID=UPI0011BDDA79|nr:carbamoyltransferase C-terminal domain-containing protein [Shimia ponticola]
MRVLSIHNIGHDCGAAAFDDDGLLFSIEAERLTRRRYEHEAKPAVEHLLDETGLEISDFDLVVLSVPTRQDFLTVDDYDTHFAALKAGAFHAESHCEIMGHKVRCILVAHEVCHAACGIQEAGAEAQNAAILVNEGRGLWGRCSLFSLQNTDLKLRDVDFLPWYCTGFGWSALGDVLGFGKSPGVAGHLMAIASFSEPKACLSEALKGISDDVLHGTDAAIAASQELQRHDKFGRDFNSAASLLATLQNLFSDGLFQALQSRQEVQDADALILSGGCALNIVANSKLRMGIGKPLFIPANCNDSGQALGAGLYVRKFILGLPDAQVAIDTNGAAPKEAEVARFAELTGLHMEDADPRSVAALLAQGKILGVCTGPSELGPRSLGNRSILASADMPGLFETVSLRLKRREWYRPVCASFSEDAFAAIWPNEEPSPHMMYSYDLPDGVAPEARHVDGSCRAHSVSRSVNPWYHDVLQEYEGQSGAKGVINTSLNSAGRAMVFSPDHILQDFSVSELDGYVVGEKLFTHA